MTALPDQGPNSLLRSDPAKLFLIHTAASRQEHLQSGYMATQGGGVRGEASVMVPFPFQRTGGARGFAGESAKPGTAGTHCFAG
jgi:hypothetical protein